MTQLVLEIPRNQDVELLLVLLRRLDVRVVKKSVVPAKETPQEDEDVAFILNGLPPKEDFEAFVRDFEASRQDMPLPGREN